MLPFIVVVGIFMPSLSYAVQRNSVLGFIVSEIIVCDSVSDVKPTVVRTMGLKYLVYNC